VNLQGRQAVAEVGAQASPKAEAEGSQGHVLKEARPEPLRSEAKTRTSYVTPAAADGVPVRRSEALPAAIQIEGLRSGKSAEAMVAMRLAIAQSLDMQSESVKNLPRAVLLWCDFDAAGQLVAVRGESGIMSLGLQAAVRRAAASVALPERLVGQAFSLDLLLEASD
jgi:hypothetical protein